MKTKTILKTDPHGAQTLRQIEPSESNKVGNRLYDLSAIATYGTAQIAHVVMTGEELTSLANQWLEYAKSAGTANAPAHRRE